METANLNLHIEPHLMQQAEKILAAIGVSTESAVDMLFRHVVMRGGLPFETKLPAPPHLCADLLSDDEIDNMLRESIDEMKQTGGIPAEQAFAEINKKLGIADV